MACRLWFAVVLLILSCAGNAQQQAIQTFSYQIEHKNQQYSLQFELPTTVLNDHFRDFRRYQPQFLEQYLWRDIQQHASRYPQLTVQAGPISQRLQFKVKGQNSKDISKLTQELQQLIQQRQHEYLAAAYYHRQRFPDGRDYIIPDHLRMLQHSLSALTPVSNAIQQLMPETTSRELSAFLLSWLQQLPYADLSDRAISAGTSFNPPLTILRDNRGDCDSKAVLMAALFNSLLPDKKLVIIYLPEHAMLGIEMPAEPNDETITLDGITYVLADPTGPAALSPGQISPDYRMYTRNRFVAWRELTQASD